MISVFSDAEKATAGCCADYGQVVMRRTAHFDERAKVTCEVCIKCLVLRYQRRQFEAGRCG